MFSRREFFSQLGGRISSHVQEVFTQTSGEDLRESPSGVNIEETLWVATDSIFRFEVGSATHFADQGVTVRALPEGFVVTDRSGKVRAMKLSPQGVLMFHQKENWPDQAVLSIMTGDMQLVKKEGSHER